MPATMSSITSRAKKPSTRSRPRALIARSMGETRCRAISYPQFPGAFTPRNTRACACTVPRLRSQPHRNALCALTRTVTVTIWTPAPLVSTRAASNETLESFVSLTNWVAALSASPGSMVSWLLRRACSLMPCAAPYRAACSAMSYPRCLASSAMPPSNTRPVSSRKAGAMMATIGEIAPRSERFSRRNMSSARTERVDRRARRRGEREVAGRDEGEVAERHRAGHPDHGGPAGGRVTATGVHARVAAGEAGVLEGGLGGVLRLLLAQRETVGAGRVLRRRLHLAARLGHPVPAEHQHQDGHQRRGEQHHLDGERAPVAPAAGAGHGTNRSVGPRW